MTSGESEPEFMPASAEIDRKDTFHPSEQGALDKLDEELGPEPTYLIGDDRKRPLPQDDVWGIPGAEEQ